MIEITSSISGKTIKAKELEALLTPLGYTLGGNWDYDHGYYDYKVSEEEGYTFLRIPFKAIEEEVGSSHAVYEIGTPYVLHHVYQGGNDEERISGYIPPTVDGLINQFQSPIEKDADVDPKYEPIARSLIAEIEQAFHA